MSRRRELARRMDALSDIAGIMSAMKGLALMETRILQEFLGSQRRMVAGIEAAAGDFLAWHGGVTGEPATDGGGLCVLVGSEQGFCGDFNEALLSASARLLGGQRVPARRVVLGQRLAGRSGAREDVDLALPGAIVADEVPAVLLRLTRELGDLLARGEPAARSLSVVYHCDATREVRLRRLLPLGGLQPPGRDHRHGAELTLAPADFLSGLTRHYLHAVLNEVLYSSLMAENRQRQAHMDRALQRLDAETEKLRLACNRQRQEEITEEIEVILLSAEMMGLAGQ
jgi:F-type H+-transporting ATPase subunit gamma